MKTLELEIKALPKTPNQLLGAHWRTRSSHAKKWLFLVQQAFMIKGLQWKLGLESAQLTLTRCSSMQCDADNLRSSFKSVVDALVKLGTIVDDNPTVIGTPVVLWEKARPRAGFIKVKIEYNKRDKF